MFGYEVGSAKSRDVSRQPEPEMIIEQAPSSLLERSLGNGPCKTHREAKSLFCWGTGCRNPNAR